MDNDTVVGIAINPFDRFGPQDFLNKYAIIANNHYSWIPEINTPEFSIHSIKSINPNLNYKNYSTMIQSSEFLKLLGDIENPALLPYKPSMEMEKFVYRNGNKYLCNSFKLSAMIENKQSFRELFSNIDINLPEYEIVPFTKYNLQQILDIYRRKFIRFVIQEPGSSGGKGTYIIKEENDYKDFVNRIDHKYSGNLVVSRYISGEVSSIQACIIGNQVLSTGLQTQIISDPALLNRKLSGSGQFCGGEFGYREYKLETITQAQKIVQEIGLKLKSIGYRGIFGIDIIIDADGNIYTIEVNARLTGLTPIITQLQLAYNESTLLEQHIRSFYGLESNLEISREELFQKNRKGGYFFLFNKLSHPIMIRRNVKPGIYEYSNSKLVFIKRSFSLKNIENQNQFLIPDYPDSGTEINSQSRVFRILTKNRVLDDNNRISNNFKEIIQKIEEEYLY